MANPNQTYDFVVIGGGIVGLTIARELVRRRGGTVAVLEKEAMLGRHASGRNSGVIHAGIYYAADSMKAKYCTEGARRMYEFAEEFNVAHRKSGKVIVATDEERVASLDVLLKRARTNGVNIRKIDQKELAALEPAARTHGYALYSPDTGVIDTVALLETLHRQLEDFGVRVFLGVRVIGISPRARTIRTSRGSVAYGHLINCAGVFADKIAHEMGLVPSLRILPFKGLFWIGSGGTARRVNGSIYPAPDLSLPFLGVHATRSIDDKVYFGPNAIPALGRENYSVLSGVNLIETPVILWNLLRCYIRNKRGFRRSVTGELRKYSRRTFLRECRKLMPDLEGRDISRSSKVGIRAQLVDVKAKELVMDFRVEKGEHSTHVLNAVSPAFTCSFEFAREIVEQYLG